MARFSAVASSFPGEVRLAGLILVLAFVSFAIGASTPMVGKKGSPRFWGLPVREYLANVAANARGWRWGNVFMGGAIILLLIGLTLLTTLLEGANESVWSRVGLVLFLVSAVLWVIFSAFRATVAVEAGEALASTGEVPAYYEPLAGWGTAMFRAYAVTGFLGLVCYGAALLLVALVPAWAGWATVVFSLAMLVLFFITGDTLPAFHYVPPLLIGIILLIGG